MHAYFVGCVQAEGVLSGVVRQSLSTLTANLANTNTATNAIVSGAESAEASLNARFLKAQADVTNKVSFVVDECYNTFE